MNEQERNEAVVESAELTEEALGEVTGGNAPLAGDPDDETLGNGPTLGAIDKKEYAQSPTVKRRRKSETPRKNNKKKHY